MKITLKTIRQQTFKVEIGDDATVQELKDKIEAENRDYPSKQLKLIYSGKILQDSESLSEYKISESSFVVVMVSKAKAPQPSSSAPKPVTTRTPPTQTATEQPSPMQSSSRQPTDSTMETEGTDSVLSRDQQTTATTTAPSQPQDRSSQPPTANVPSQEEEVVSPQESSLAQASSTLAVGDQYVDAVMSLIALGYDRSEVERAMAASFNNPDRAFDYLENGIPESAFRDQPSAQEGPVDQPGGEPGEEMEGEEPQVSQDPPPLRQPQEVAAQEQVQGRGNNPLAFLRSLPQFRTMQQAIQRNPHMLQGMLEELGQSYPQLLQVN
jgi:UV excision repair protein RAD23